MPDRSRPKYSPKNAVLYLDFPKSRSWESTGCDSMIQHDPTTRDTSIDVARVLIRSASLLNINRSRIVSQPDLRFERTPYDPFMNLRLTCETETICSCMLSRRGLGVWATSIRDAGFSLTSSQSLFSLRPYRRHRPVHRLVVQRSVVD